MALADPSVITLAGPGTAGRICCDDGPLGLGSAGAVLAGAIVDRRDAWSCGAASGAGSGGESATPGARPAFCAAGFGARRLHALLLGVQRAPRPSPG
jgi:hypothetical protein